MDPSWSGDLLSATWKRLQRASDDPADSMRVMTLASVTPEGRPAARLMVIRGVDASRRTIWCHTRSPAAKIADFRACPFFALIAWDRAESVQLRITGAVRVHEADATASAHHEQSGLLRMLAAIQGSQSSRTQPDLLWPGSVEGLQHEMRRDAARHFAVLEMLAEQIHWSRVEGDKTSERRFNLSGAE